MLEAKKTVLYVCNMDPHFNSK